MSYARATPCNHCNCIVCGKPMEIVWCFWCESCLAKDKRGEILYPAQACWEIGEPKNLNSLDA